MANVSVLSLRTMTVYRRLVVGPLAEEMENPKHDPAMLNEVLEVLNLRPGDVVVDGTVGLAGHSLEFARLIAPMGHIVGFDWDASMLDIAKARLGEISDVKVTLVNRDFRTMSEEMEELGVTANGILLDLGLNSAQIDDPTRGISFLQDGPLDMRMDRTSGEPAAALLNRLTPAQIERGLRDFGDERWANAIARKIVERRKTQPLRTTADLVECVLAAVPIRARDKRIHPATRTFQAVRVMTTGELDELEGAIVACAECLAPNGTLVVLSYHSGEDRAAKNAFRELAETGEFKEIYKKPIGPTEEEVRRNARSRSAKLRALRKN